MVDNSTNDEAVKFIDFYINLIENNNQKDLPFYLSSNVILDWFGKTIKTRKMVTTYFRDKIGKITHLLNDNDVKFVEHIAFRDTHEIKIPKDESVIITPSSPPFNYSNNINNDDNNITPPSLIKRTTTTEPSTSSNSVEMGQGDGIQNLLMSPYKKMKLLSEDEDEDDDDDDDDDSNDGDNINNNENIRKSIKYITASGRIQFHRPSIKKFQTETKWERPIKLHIGYTSNNFKDCTIYLIIYEGNLKCRRNLYQNFCEIDKQQND